MNLDQKLAHTRWLAASHRQAADDITRPMPERREHGLAADQLDHEGDELLEQVNQRDQAEGKTPRGPGPSQVNAERIATRFHPHDHHAEDNNTYSRDHGLDAYLAKLKKPPGTSPLHEQLAWHLAERQNAIEWAHAFELRASACRPEYQRQRQHELDEQTKWHNHQLAEAKEIRRIRDALRNAKTRH